MSKPNKTRKIKKRDYDRAVVTETIPYETPIIFSNEGLYDALKSESNWSSVASSIFNKLVLGAKTAGGSPWTVPFLYKIRKNATEYRRLALVHPHAQLKFRKFYEKYENLILYYCNQSPASIRAPQGIASTFYTKTSWSNINQYKTEDTVETSETDGFSKYSPSYFSYRGHDRLYKFFESEDYFELEKNFAHLWTLDVSKCFDSIYTHSLSWAVKDKEFTKTHVAVESTFAQEFDSIMRFANHQETNGIVIGPEISRIFAEIILQEVDRSVIKKINDKYGLEFGVGYSFRRYVDDVFIFSKSEKVAQDIYDCYTDKLLDFNLHSNRAKTTKISRPFVTKKSSIIKESSQKANSFIDKFLQEEEETRLRPLDIKYKWRLTKSFIDDIKSLCLHNSVNYDEISSYLISLLSERVKKLVNIEKEPKDKEESTKYKEAILVLLEALFFFYSVSPSVSASYKLCTSIIVISRFSKKHLKDHQHTIYQHIYNLTESFISSSSYGERRSAVESSISLELVNIILAIRDLGENYLLPEETVKQIFFDEETMSYFDMVSCFFYIKDHERYKSLASALINKLKFKLNNLSDIQSNSEKALLFLDMMSCPYIDEGTKKTWLFEFYKAMQLGSSIPTAESSAFLSKCKDYTWFIDWEEVDLLHCLEKKELKRAY